jgi:hypothetical protein
MRLQGSLRSVVWLLVAALARSQDGPAKLLLPHPVRVHGVVIDSAGDPIPEIRVDHIALTDDSARTDSSGRFDVEANGPSVVFRGRGWKSQLVRVQKLGSDARIVLERSGDVDPLPVCSKKARCVTAGGIFCLPKVRGVDISDIPFGVDAFEREFTISSWAGRWKTMTHGTGTSWGGPQPRTAEIWDSLEFSETQHDARSQFVLDAPGKTSDGKLWRSVGRSGESVFYYGQNQKDAMLFDKMLDGLCVVPAK